MRHSMHAFGVLVMSICIMSGHGRGKGIRLLQWQVRRLCGSSASLSLGVFVFHGLTVLFVGVGLVSDVLDLNILDATLVGRDRGGRFQQLAAVLVIVTGFFNSGTSVGLVGGADGGGSLGVGV